MVKHPAKYTDEVLVVIGEMVGEGGRVLDPFAGVGKLRRVRPDAYLVEIEPEWAVEGGGLVGDALLLPFRGDVFDVVCTSPTYGNRMADSYEDGRPEKGYDRRTYRHVLGRALDRRNSGSLQWGKEYRWFHIQAWLEVRRVMKVGGRLVLNMSDHIRGGKVQAVTDWHIEQLIGMGYELLEHRQVRTPRMTKGRNWQVRVGYESVILFGLKERK